jgi:acyl carrier protein
MTQTTTDTPTAAASTEAPSVDVVLGEIDGMLRTILDEYGLDDAEIGMDTRFHDDLELESIDLITLAGKLEARYGSRVNFAEFIADLDIEEIIALTVGRLVQYVATALNSGNEG